MQDTTDKKTPATCVNNNCDEVLFVVYVPSIEGAKCASCGQYLEEAED